MAMGSEMFGAARRCRPPSVKVSALLAPPLSLTSVSALLAHPLPLPSTSTAAMLGVLRQRVPLQPRQTVHRLAAYNFPRAGGAAGGSSASCRAFAAAATGGVSVGGGAVATSSQDEDAAAKGESGTPPGGKERTRNSSSSSVDAADIRRLVKAPGEDVGSSASSAAATSGDFGGLSPDGSGLDLDTGPILADFLAMGAGHLATTTVISRPVRIRHDQLHQTRPQPVNDEKTARAAEDIHAVEEREEVHERRLVTAALQRSQPIEPEFHEAPARLPLERAPALRFQQDVPELFAQGYAGYVETCRADQQAESGSEVGQASASSREERKKPKQSLEVVLPWHRESITKILCRNLMNWFVQETRVALRLPSTSRVIWLWERSRAQEHADAGLVLPLVKYLVETELHMKFGPERKIRQPGNFRINPEAKHRLRAERRNMSDDWEVVARMRHLEEDDVIRIFLDGCTSWAQVRDLLEPVAREQPEGLFEPVPKEATEGDE